MKTGTAMKAALSELADVADKIDDHAVAEACAIICEARYIMLFGCGREGLQMQGLAMRLYHLGLSVSMQGDMAAPPLSGADLFIASAGPGHLTTVDALVGQAKSGGAKVLFLTAQPNCASALAADQILCIPAQTMADDQTAKASVLPMGSLYEAAMGLMFEAMVLQLRTQLGETPDTIRARHTNME